MSHWYWIAYTVVIACLFAFASWSIANSLSAAASRIKWSGGRTVAWEPFAVVALVVGVLSFVL